MIDEGYKINPPSSMDEIMKILNTKAGFMHSSMWIPKN